MDLSATAGAGDDNFASPAGNTADGGAVFAGKILVVLVLHAVELALDGPPHLLQELGVLGAALLQVLGEHTEQRPEHQHAGHGAEDAVSKIVLDEHIHDIQSNDGPDGKKTQMVCTVAAIHEAGQRIADFAKDTHRMPSLFVMVCRCPYFTPKFRQGKGARRKIHSFVTIAPARSAPFPHRRRVKSRFRLAKKTAGRYNI